MTDDEKDYSISRSISTNMPRGAVRPGGPDAHGGKRLGCSPRRSKPLSVGPRPGRTSSPLQPQLSQNHWLRRSAALTQHAAQECAKEPAGVHVLCLAIVPTGEQLTDKGVAVAVGIDELDRKVLVGAVDDPRSDLADMIEFHPDY